MISIVSVCSADLLSQVYACRAFLVNSLVRSPTPISRLGGVKSLAGLTLVSSERPGMLHSSVSDTYEQLVARAGQGSSVPVRPVLFFHLLVFRHRLGFFH